MGAFNELSHAVHGGEKIFKYKQNKLIECVQGHVDNEEYLVGKGGVCATLTMRWLAQRLGIATSTSDPGFGQGGRGSMERDTADIHTAQQSVVMYHELKRMGEGSSKSAALKAVGKRYGLTLDVSHVDDTSQYGYLADVITGNLTECELFNHGYYLAYTVHDSRNMPVGAHAVGLMGRDGACFFFDPNIGEYKLLDAGEFLAAYKKCYSSSLGWNLDKSLAYSCWVEQ